MIKSILKFIIAALFIPLVISSSSSFWQELMMIQGITSSQRYLLYGAAAYVLCFILAFRLDYIYVFEHEIGHAIMVWFFGGKVKSIKVSKESGSVTSDKSNLLIALAPYLLPLDTALIALIYFTFGCFYVLTLFFGIFLFLIGFSFTMHVILTLDKIRTEQSDFLGLGHLGSVVVIYVINVILMTLLLSFIFKEISFQNFIMSFWSHTKDLYMAIFRQLFL